MRSYFKVSIDEAGYVHPNTGDGWDAFAMMQRKAAFIADVNQLGGLYANQLLLVNQAGDVLVFFGSVFDFMTLFYQFGNYEDHPKN